MEDCGTFAKSGHSVGSSVGGVEIAVRYVARANERYQLRAKLYQAAVDLLGTKNMPYVGIPVVPAIPTGDYTHKPTNE